MRMSAMAWCVVLVAGCGGGPAPEPHVKAEMIIDARGVSGAPVLRVANEEAVCDDASMLQCATSPSAPEIFAGARGALLVSNPIDGVVGTRASGDRVTYGSVGDGQGQYLRAAAMRGSRDGGLLVWDARGHRLLAYDSAGTSRGEWRFPLDADPGGRWYKQDIADVGLADSALVFLSIARSDSIGREERGTLWRVALDGTAEPLASLPVRALTVANSDMQPPSPFFAQPPLVAVAGDGTIIYVDPTQDAALELLTPRDTSAIDVRVTAPLRPVTREELAQKTAESWAEVAQAPVASFSAQCADPQSISCRTAAHFTEAARLAPRHYPFVTAVRPAARDPHLFWLRQSPRAAEDSVEWDLLTTTGRLIARAMFGARDLVVPLDAEEAYRGRLNGAGGIAVARVHLVPGGARP